MAKDSGGRSESIFPNAREKPRATGTIAVVSHIAGHKRCNIYARFSIGTTFPSRLCTRGTTAALASSSRAVAMYFA